MRTRQMTAVAAALLIAIVGSGLHASTAHAAFDKDELKCRKGLAKGMLKAISTADKTSAGCHKSRHSGKVGAGVDCNDLGSAPGSPGAADTKGKFAKSQQKLIDTPAKKCVGLDDDVLGEFISCPEPCNTTLGLGDTIADYNQVASCMACVAADVVGTKNATLLGSPDPLLMSKDDAKCAQSIGKGYGKYLSTILKTRTKCQDTFEKDGGTGLDPTCQNSPDPDGKGKIAKSLSKAQDGLDKSCAAATLANVGGCSAADIATLKTCSQADSDTADTLSFRNHYEFLPLICPTGAMTTVQAGVGIAGNTVSRLDIGWRGLAHNFDVPDAYSVVVDATCPNSVPPCGTCISTGIRTSHPNSQLFMRCNNDFAIKCDELFTNDLDDCGGSFCTYVLGAPVPVSAGGNPSCSINALASDLTGTGNVETNQASAQTNFATRVYTGGSSSLTQPCPVCNGDITPNDGSPDGTCDQGARHGLPCDTNSFDATFASQANGSGLSLDCVPTAPENISGTGLAISFELTTGASSLGAEVACDSPLGVFDCFCGQCSGDTSMSCVNDTDCSDVGAGACTANTSGVTRQPNDCSDFSNCTDIGDSKGECLVKNDQWCAGLVKANGRGFLGCLNDAECINPSFPCPGGDCGPCTLVQQRSCFLDPLETQGQANEDNPVLAGTFCIPPTLNPAINTSSGTPGPGRVVVQQTIQRLYD